MPEIRAWSPSHTYCTIIVNYDWSIHEFAISICVQRLSIYVCVCVCVCVEARRNSVRKQTPSSLLHGANHMYACMYEQGSPFSYLC